MKKNGDSKLNMKKIKEGNKDKKCNKINRIKNINRNKQIIKKIS